MQRFRMPRGSYQFAQVCLIAELGINRKEVRKCHGAAMPAPRERRVLWDSVCDNRIDHWGGSKERVKSVSIIAADEPAVKPTAIHTVLRERKESRD